MPIEIRELHIRLSIDPRPVGGAEGSNSNGEPKGASAPGARRAEADELVARCVEQVMELLRHKDER